MSAFADPYKRCLECDAWVDSAMTLTAGALQLSPCGHISDYGSVCSSWGPVDGCRCTPKGHGRTSIPEGKVA
jgi:hypothetical protein